MAMALGMSLHFVNIMLTSCPAASSPDCGLVHSPQLVLCSSTKAWHWHAGYEPPQLEGAAAQDREGQAGAAENRAELGAASSMQQPHADTHGRSRLDRHGEPGEPMERSESVVNVGRFRRALTRCREQLNKASPVVRCRPPHKATNADPCTQRTVCTVSAQARGL